MTIGTEQYAVWCPDEGEARDDCSLIKAYDLEEAAKNFVEKRYHDDPFESPMTVVVRGPWGDIKTFSVHPEPSIDFFAYEVKS